MRKRVPVVLGGGLALLVASQYFDFGLGFREGSGPVDSVTDAALDAEVESIEQAIKEVDSAQPLTSPDSMSDPVEFVPTTPTPPSVVDILIDANQYWVATNASDLDQREPKTLDEIIAMAATVAGEDNGIRVRIARTPDAVAAAEAAVLNRLGEAGLNKDEIDSRRQLVE